MAARRVFIALAPLLALSSMAVAQQTRLGAAGTNLLNYRGQVGKQLSLVCAPNQPPADVYGTDVYTDDSAVCHAAVHAGVITSSKGGPVTVVIGGPQRSFQGTARNGITSREFGQWPGSYSFDPAGGTAEVDWSTTANGLEGYAGTVTVQCPAGGTLKRVWGTDVYTSDSSICSAAVHAGLLTPASGGTVALKVSAGRDAYTGSERNGVVSDTYGGWQSSLELMKPVVAANRARALPAPTTAIERAGPAGATATGQASPGAVTARTGPAGPARANPRVPTITAPANVAATYLSGGNVAVAWDSVPGATSYDVLATTATNSAGFGISQAPVTDAYHVSRALTPDTYTISVRANGDAGTSPQSQPVTVTVPRWYGKYRVTINGFKVIHETFDNPAEIDGKRDEIFVKARTQVFHSVGVALSPEVTIRSLTHGDVNAPRWRDVTKPNFRINAGSASSMGGLMTGDGYPNKLMPWKRVPGAPEGTRTFPLLVWEGDLYQDMNTAVIIPSIWEDDEKLTELPLELNYFPPLQIATAPLKQQESTTIGRGFKIIRQKTIDMTKPLFPNTQAMQQHMVTKKQTMAANPLVADMVDRFRPLLQNVNTKVGGMLAAVALMSNSQDRPIGLTPTGSAWTLDPAVVLLNYDNAEKVIAGTADGSIEPGILQIVYQDKVSGGQGNYALFVEVRRQN
ncbi:MAG: hypothetical protein QOH59_2043 [Gemmatimonadales bacterium]|nr:hypothetical protein [Gemmatimonadales bacterium]